MSQFLLLVFARFSLNNLSRGTIERSESCRECYRDIVNRVLPSPICSNHFLCKHGFETLKLWSFYVDPEGSIGTVESA
ncbi:hypothetical protein F5J12DRAFT_823480 [Pisolithus orientalis]|uniref:uncharacterized protein n=1 Tax=Pisolithus orientalis TaxID=936130 RepID=UPI002224542F|nr:uncharacterized protein F5J12DRAFT_823480 [Pisolithus orientalis]KAI6009415.1 hypothetical protein F5J12DRAFT_823480 [Pisolithus orientalis]